jgi:lipopolysaccharide heptosyltransferase II
MLAPPPDNRSRAPTRILAVKLADIGDLLLVTPALRALRQRYPFATVDALVTPGSAPALENLPLVDAILTFDKFEYDRPLQALRVRRLWELVGFARGLRARHYDTLILFHHLSLPFGALKHAFLALATGAACRIGLDNGRGWFLTHRVPDQGFGVKHELDYFLELAAAAGAPAVSRRVEIGLTDADRTVAAELLPPSGRPTIALHPGSGGYSLARRWDMVKFSQLGRRLRQACGARIVVVGTPADGTDELEAALGGEVINLGGRTTLTQMAAVLARCQLLVGADSGVLHVASAAGTPTIALFGPTNHRAWAPALPPDRLTIIRSAIHCSPCAYTQQGLGTPAGCLKRTCMALISVDSVYEAAVSALAKGKRPDEQG